MKGFFISYTIYRRQKPIHGKYQRRQLWKDLERSSTTGFFGAQEKVSLSLSPRRRPKPREKVVYGPARMLPPLSLSLEVSASCIPSSTKTKWPSTPRGVVVRRCAVIVDSLMTRTRTKEDSGLQVVTHSPAPPCLFNVPPLPSRRARARLLTNYFSCDKDPFFGPS